MFVYGTQSPCVYAFFCILWESDTEMDELFEYFFKTHIGPSGMSLTPIPIGQRGAEADYHIRSVVLRKISGRGNPFFPKHEWNFFDRVFAQAPRTNNAVEAWHGVVNRTVSGIPTMSTLLAVIQNEEEAARQDVRERELNPSRPLRGHTARFNYRKHNEDLQLTVADFTNLQSNPVRYLHCLSYHVAN